ncbi:MAG: efflux RND transporter periplasmic adaptor subunit [Acidobacteriota bacterium]
MNRKKALKYGVLAVVVLGLLTWGFSYFFKGDRRLADKYLTVKAQRGNVKRTVSSTGTLQAVITVQVGSQVSGRIQELHADFNSVVKKGQVLAVIDPANFEAQRDRAEASLATALAAVKNAEANLNNRRAELVSAKANLEAANVTLRDAERQLKRSQGLFQDGLIPERDLDNAQAAFEQATARVAQAAAQVTQIEASIRSAQAQQEQANANVKQARAELQMAEVNLRYTNIISPIDGVVIERNVDIGQTVAASFQAPILFLIANDLTKMQLIAQIDEADIGALSEQAKVEFAVDAFPGQSFRGRISEIRLSSKLPATSTSGSTSQGGGTASNVVVYNVMIDVDNPQLKLRPGMTANVNFTVADAQDVLKVANAALRYRPADKDPAEIQKLMGSFTGLVSADTHKPGEDSVRKEDSFGDPSGRTRRWQAGGEGPGLAGERRPRNGPGSASGWTRRQSGAQATVGPPGTEIFGIDPGLKIRFPHAEEPMPVPGMVWVLDAKDQPQPRRVKLGITNGRETAVLDGELKEGETVITGEIGDTDAQGGSPFATSPFRGAMPRGGGRRGGR